MKIERGKSDFHLSPYSQHLNLDNFLVQTKFVVNWLVLNKMSGVKGIPRSENFYLFFCRFY